MSLLSPVQRLGSTGDRSSFRRIYGEAVRLAEALLSICDEFLGSGRIRLLQGPENGMLSQHPGGADCNVWAEKAKLDLRSTDMKEMLRGSIASDAFCHAIRTHRRPHDQDGTSYFVPKFSQGRPVIRNSSKSIQDSMSLPADAMLADVTGVLHQAPGWFR